MQQAVSAALHPGPAESESWRVDVVLDELEVPEDLRSRPLSALSGDWQRMALLARVWVTGPDALLPDEPTNHLDIEGQEALEGELLAQEACCLLVSHDRSFVRAVGNRFWQIDGKTLVEVDSPEPFFAASLAAGKLG